MNMGLRERDAQAIAGIEKLRFSPLAASRGEGAYVFDEDGRKILDLSSSAGAASLGYAHPRVVEAISRQAETLTLCPNYLYNDVRAEFASMLEDWAR